MDFSQIISLLAELQTKLADVEAFAKEQYDKGFADGVASVPPAPSEDPLQGQLDAANAKISEMAAQIASMQAQIDAFPALVADAVAQEKGRLVSIVQAEDADLIAKLQM